MILSPSFSAFIVKDALVAFCVIVPSRPASFAFRYLVTLSVSPLSRYISLNFVVSDTRSISVRSCVTSSWIVWRSESALVPFDALVASSFMRCSISCTSVSAPSAVCTALMPSSAFREAWDRPRICLRIFSEMERPAASSAARFTLYPDDSFSADLDNVPCVMPNILLAFIALRLCCTTIINTSMCFYGDWLSKWTAHYSRDNSFCPLAVSAGTASAILCKLVLYNLHHMQDYINIYIG